MIHALTLVNNSLSVLNNRKFNIEIHYQALSAIMELWLIRIFSDVSGRRQDCQTINRILQKYVNNVTFCPSCVTLTGIV
jgi:capsule polysaccharide modification protein KpsS